MLYLLSHNHNKVPFHDAQCGVETVTQTHADMHSSQLTHLTQTPCHGMDGASVYMQSPITIRSHPLPFRNFVVPNMYVDCAWTQRTESPDAVGCPPPCSHITSRWYSSPDCAAAAILGQLTATHKIGLGA